MKQIGLKCKSAGVKRVLVSGIVANNKLTSAYILSVNQPIFNMCRDNSFVFIDNNNIPTPSLFHDGLHLLEVGKRILADNFIDNLNNFLRIRQTQLPPPYFHPLTPVSEISRVKINSVMKVSKN